MKPHVKICGITNVGDAMAAAEAGADYLGYIFYAPSKRFVAPRVARDIVSSVRQLHPDVLHIGVFVDETEENIVWTRALVALDYVQLHGTESPATCEALTSTGIDIIKALSYRDGAWTVNARDYNVSYFLCDTHDPVKKGGTGERFDLAALPAGIDLTRTFIAGGLRLENVDQVLAEVSPFALDVSSGVEDAPGRKNHKRIQDFIQTVRQHAAATIEE